MYTQVASKQVVVFGTVEFSQAVSMEGGNAVQFEVTCFAKGTGDLSVQLQGSNDLQNWDDFGTAVACDAVGYFSNAAAIDAIAYQYVRLEYTQATAGTGIVAAGINVANL